MTSMPQDFKNKIKIFYFSVFLNPFEILSLYSNLYNFYWLKEDVQWIIDRVLRETLMVHLASTLSSRTFLLIF